MADISDEVAQCAELVDILKDKRLRERLAHIYARLFRFYRDVIAWYSKSRASKLISSLNENLQDRFQDAMNYIRRSIEGLHRQAGNIGHSMMRSSYGDIKDNKHELFRQQQNWATDWEPGKEGLKFLHETIRDMRDMQAMWRENLAAFYARARRDPRDQGFESFEKRRIGNTPEHMPADSDRPATPKGVSARALREYFQKLKKILPETKGCICSRMESFGSQTE